jgi:hypothetical protein
MDMGRDHEGPGDDLTLMKIGWNDKEKSCFVRIVW